MKRNRLLLRCLLWGAVAAWMTLIFLFSAQNGGESSSLSGKVTDFLLRLFVPDFKGMTAADQAALVEPLQFLIRKGAHAGVYAVLGVLSFLAVRAHAPRRGLLLLLPPAICLVYAASDEFHQSFIPGRSPQITDVLIDFGGALVGILFIAALLLLIQRLRRKRYSDSAAS